MLSKTSNNVSKDVMLICENERDAPYAQQLAQHLGCAVAQPCDAPNTPFLLHIGSCGVVLHGADDCSKGVRVDFVEGAARHRRLFGGGKNQMIAKAVGVTDKPGLHVVDATAGLGRDAFVLASLGCNVVMLERNPVVAALLQDGLLRAQRSETVADIVTRMHLVHVVAHNWLQQNSADVIYLDPMFPESNKSAQVKKEMRFFHALVGKDADADKLLELALTKATYRVVVKRPRLAPPLANQTPTYALTGKTNRFDVYALKSLKKI